MMILPAQLVFCSFDSRQQLLDTSVIIHGQQRRSTVYLLVGRAGVQNVCAVTLFKSPRLLYPSLSTLLSSHGGRNRSSSSILKRLSGNANGSGEAQTTEELWEEYFVDPSQWWDNRVDKSNPRSPDFKHKVTRKALWVDGRSNPPWVKAMLKSVTQGKLQCRGCTKFMHNSQGKICRLSSPQATTSRGTVVKIEKLCEEYSAKPSEWSHNCATKTNPQYPDFKHKHTREGLWVGDLRNPPWVKQQLNAASEDTTNSDDQSPLENKRKLRIQRRPISQTGVAIAILKKHLQRGIPIDSYMYVEVLQRCFKEKDLVSAKQVQECIRKSAMEQNKYVANNLLRVYIRCGRLQDARRVFDKLVKKNVFSWTIMIGGYAQHDHAEDAIEVFNQMCQEGAQPNVVTYLSILKACASTIGLKWGKEIHAHIRQGGFGSDVRVGTALVNMYAKSGSIDDARLVFERMEDRNVITWTVMIGALAQHGCGHEAYQLFLQMQRGGFVPNEFTYVSILNSCASAGALEWVKDVHSHALKAGLESDLRVGNALVHMYAKSGSIDDARLVFDRVVERDVVTWTVMIGGLAQHGFGHEAFSLFLQMQRGGFVPNAITYVSILSACASSGALKWVKEVHRHALRAGLESDVRVSNALVHMYAKSGSIDDARLVFDRIVDRDVITWNVMIGGLAQHGCGHEALLLFGKMNAEGVRPNGVTFVATLSACSHVGLVGKGRHQFLAMTQDYGIKPTMEHYTCMVDLLGRAGHLEEAKLFILNMPLEPAGATWGALLGACRTYGNVELAEFAADECLKLEPKNSAAYVLLSNIYAAAGKWDQVSLVRTMMQGRGIHKEPGRSWIEVDNEIHHFVVGDTSHPEAKEIYAELNILTRKMKAEGYIPDTRLVLHDIDEEDKELALCSHSEKLAIAYGLMRTAHGNPIRIYKNLRVCSDCHTATKFISKVTGREIVARDASRFHHFKDGVCSCGDYW